MRFGDIVLLLLVILISFGFLASHSIHLNTELEETRRRLAIAQADLKALEARYQAVVGEKNRLADQVAGLTSKNGVLHNQVETLEVERQALRAQIEELQSKLALIEAANPILTRLISSPAGRVVALILLPILPLSFGAVYVMTYKKAVNSSTVPTQGTGGRPTTCQATLTREEFHLIAMHRRSRAVPRSIGT